MEFFASVPGIFYAEIVKCIQEFHHIVSNKVIVCGSEEIILVFGGKHVQPIMHFLWVIPDPAFRFSRVQGQPINIK